jgi:hypothetical protein
LCAARLCSPMPAASVAAWRGSPAPRHGGQPRGPAVTRCPGVASQLGPWCGQRSSCVRQGLRRGLPRPARAVPAEGGRHGQPARQRASVSARPRAQASGPCAWSPLVAMADPPAFGRVTEQRSPVARPPLMPASRRAILAMSWVPLSVDRCYPRSCLRTHARRLETRKKKSSWAHQHVVNCSPHDLLITCT